MMFSTTQLLSVVFLTLATLDVTHGGSSSNQLRGKVEEQAVSSLSLLWNHLRKLTRDPDDPDQIQDIIVESLPSDEDEDEDEEDEAPEEVGLDEAEEEDASFCTDSPTALWRVPKTGIEHNMCEWVNKEGTTDEMKVRKCGKFVPLWNDKSEKAQEKLSAEQIESDMKTKSFQGTTVADLCMVSCGKVEIGPVACWEESAVVVVPGRGRARDDGPSDDPEW